MHQDLRKQEHRPLDWITLNKIKAAPQDERWKNLAEKFNSDTMSQECT